MAESKFVPTAVVADWLGISAQAISDLASRGVIAKNAHNSWDLKATVTAYTAHMREVAAGRKADAAQALDLVQERAALARAQREHQEMRNAERAGALLPRAVVDQAIADTFTRVRAALLRIPTKATTRPQDMATPNGIRHTLDHLVRDALNELADLDVTLVKADGNDDQDD